MRQSPQLLHWMSLLVGILIMLTGCAYVTTGGLLSPVEQEELSPEPHVMPVPQGSTSLGKATAARQTASLGETGLSQRVPALDTQEHGVVHNGVLHPGMSADALRLTWGEPFYTTGRTNYDEHWYYLGTSRDLATTAQPQENRTQVDVYLVHGHILAWAALGPTGTTDNAGTLMQR